MHNDKKARKSFLENSNNTSKESGNYYDGGKGRVSTLKQVCTTCNEAINYKKNSKPCEYHQYL